MFPPQVHVGRSPKNNYFNKFISNCGEDSPLNEYIPYTNLESSDTRTKITITHPQNRSRPVINIDTRGINTSTTVPEFKSPKETIDIKYYKETHIVNSDVSDKVIYFDDLDDRKNAIAMDRFNDDEGKIYSLEEEIKENTYKITSNTLDITSPSIINIDKPIKINSKSLETNEIEDNCWDIELKDNPTPNPNPSVPEWKEVAVSTDLVTINYNLKNKNYYRVFYNGRTRDLITNIGKGTHEIKEFYYQDNENAFMLGIFNMMLTGMPMYIKNNGVSLYAEARMCNLWKLEELQE
ncbi:hypothetical protein [Spiroplasma endosymbiont of Virgichneumon dumeticola]|uniref:hypothetical protein n=1 Tax=Spiroplasma endosymbiont of Virgichneumon dumeticola TaxID=3139323 RepID=UPI0035C90D4B